MNTYQQSLWDTAALYVTCGEPVPLHIAQRLIDEGITPPDHNTIPEDYYQ